MLIFSRKIVDESEKWHFSLCPQTMTPKLLYSVIVVIIVRSVTEISQRTLVCHSKIVFRTHLMWLSKPISARVIVVVVTVHSHSRLSEAVVLVRVCVCVCMRASIIIV